MQFLTLIKAALKKKQTQCLCVQACMCECRFPKRTMGPKLWSWARAVHILTTEPLLQLQRGFFVQ